MTPIQQWGDPVGVLTCTLVKKRIHLRWFLINTGQREVSTNTL